MPLDLFQRDATEALDTASRNLAPMLPQTFSETFEPAWQYGVLFGQSTARGRARAEAMMDYIDNVHGRTGVMLPNPEFAALGQDGLGEFNAQQEKLNTQFPDLGLKPLDDAAIDELAAKKAARARVDYAKMQAREKTWGGALGAVAGSLSAGVTDPINLLAFPLAAPASLGVLGTAAAWAGIAGGTQAAIELAGLEFREKAAPGYQASGEPFANIAGAAAFGGALGGGLKGASALWQRLKVNPDLPRTIRDAGNVVESEAQVADTNPFKPLALPHPDQFRAPIDVSPEGVAWERGTFPNTMDAPPSAGPSAAELDAVHRAALAKAVDDLQAGRPVDVDEIIGPHIDAFHGSPHDFERFSVEQIGTGEGHQAFGHGLYFAEQEGIARHYAQTLAQTPPEAIAAVKVLDNLGFESVGEALTAIRAHPDWMARWGVDRSPASDVLNNFRSKPLSNLYKVRLNVDREHLLDWDKPIGQQSDAVRQRLKSLSDEMAMDDEGVIREEYGHPITVADMEKMSVREFEELTRTYYSASSDEFFANTMKEAGIPGIQYLDNGSRAAGEGTRNFVVFDDKAVAITHKNGKPVRGEARQAFVDNAMGIKREPELGLEPPKPKPAPPAIGRAQAEALAPEITTTQAAKLRAEPLTDDAVLNDFDKLRATKDVQVPVEQVDASGQRVAVMQSADKIMDEADARLAAAKEIAACATPQQEAAE